MTKLKNYLGMDYTDLRGYTLHLAAWNGEEQPMDVFNCSFEEWKSWNEWRGKRNDFTRDRVFCLIPDYTKVDTYFFAGIFEIKRRFDNWQDTGRGYEMELSDQFRDLIGKLEVKFYRYPGLRGRAFRLETLIDKMEVI